ncbi:MAG: hypothetical protein NT165_01630 [Candidatus Falkowbacteria bacterium]|nr:hypothetical protein [Candidatus Falkowbacteria bacterium]
MIANYCFAAISSTSSLEEAINLEDPAIPITPVATQGSDSLDAIAIRILPNPEHYGIERWYNVQGFAGAPQFLTVDGYEAIRDGRTVYVNATNIDSATKVIYTNVYLISYNQNSTSGTTDALGQIIANWKFNNNLTTSGDCSLAATAPIITSSSTPTITPTSTCLIDGDCLGVGFCTSPKAKIARDIKRLAVLTEIKNALQDYKNKNNRYPDLPSGSYVPHLTISTWPSWQSTFGAQLGLDKSLVDPINKLGACPGFDALTCWNKNQSKFSAQTSPLSFPDNSLVMAYQSKNSGGEYSLCASMETSDGYDTSDNLLSDQACSVRNTATTTAVNPVLEATSLQGELGREFNGFIKIANPNGNPLTWHLDASQIPAGGVFAGLSLVDTNNPNQKKIYSQKALYLGTWPIRVTVDDEHGGHLLVNANIVISKSKPKIEAENVEFILSKEKLEYVFYLNDDTVMGTGVNNFPSYTLKLGNTNLNVIGSSGMSVGINNGLELKIDRVERGRFKVTIFEPSGLISGVSGNSPVVFKYKVTLNNAIGVAATKDFTITLKPDKPVFDYQCETNVRKFGIYKCELKVLNSANHTFNYTATGTPSGFTAMVKNNNNSIFVISGNALGLAPSSSSADYLTPHGLDFYDNIIMLHDSENPLSLIGSLEAHYQVLFHDSHAFELFDSFVAPVVNPPAELNPTSSPPESNLNQLPQSFLPVLKTLSWINNIFKVSNVLAIALPPVVIPVTPIPSTYHIIVKATNEYGANTETSFDLNVNSYCGDGIRQMPNQERRGGAYNDGLEECDGIDGIATSTKDSSVGHQYSCTTVSGATTPEPITSNSYCRATGGYCGDGLCGPKDPTYSTDDLVERYDPEFNNPEAASYCHADCGFCGDGAVQSDEGEECDPSDPYSVQSSLGERCTNRCKIARELRILQVYPSSNSTSTTISSKSVLETLANSYSSFRNSMAITDGGSSTSTVKYAINAYSMASFNASTTKFLPISGNILENYNLIIFGLGTNNSDDLTASSRLIVELFIKNGGMVVFGNGTVNRNLSNRNFNNLSGYLGISSNTPDQISYSLVTDHYSIAKQPFSMPYQISVFPTTAQFKLNPYPASCGPQCSGAVCTATSSIAFPQWIEGLTDHVWASRCNRTAITQFGYHGTSSGNVLIVNPNEWKAFGNLLYYLSTLISNDNF